MKILCQKPAANFCFVMFCCPHASHKTGTRDLLVVTSGHGQYGGFADGNGNYEGFSMQIMKYGTVLAR